MDPKDLIELKSLIEAQAKLWEEFKKTNDAAIQAKADGKGVAELETKLAKISADLDKIGELKEQLEALEKKFNRPLNDTEAKEAGVLAEETKQFNLSMRSEFQSKGKPIPADLVPEEYQQYKSAFFKMMAGVSIDNMSTAERKAMSAGSDPDGGYLLPPSTVGRMVTKLFEQSTMRQIADVQNITTGKLEGIIDNDEASAGWVSELGTRSDSNTPQVGRYEIEAFEMYAMPKISQKLIDDAGMDVESWLANKVADKFGRVEGTAFCSGTGVGQAKGLFQYTAVSTGDDTRAWGQFQYVVTGTSADLSSTTKADPLQDLIGAMKDRYLNNAQFLMRREVRTKIRKLKEATTDKYLWEPSLQRGVPDSLLGYPVRVDQYVPAIAADSYSLAFGDFKEGYTIVDRIGVRTLRDPYTAKPYVVFYSTKRTGGGALNFEAVKFLKFGTS